MFQPHYPNARHQTLGADTSLTLGVATVSGGTFTKGSWADVGGATSFAFEAITICVIGSTANSEMMLDIGISDGSNRWVLVPDIRFAQEKLASEQGFQLYVPVHVPEGAQLSVRSLGSDNTKTAYVTIIGHSAGLGGAPGFSRIVALFTPSNALGVAIDPGAIANTKGSWTEMTSSCPATIGGMFGLLGYNGDTSRAGASRTLIDIGIGSGGSEFVLYPNAAFTWSTIGDGPTNCLRLPAFSCAVPSGTRIAARAQASLNTAGDRTFDLSLYGLVV